MDVYGRRWMSPVLPSYTDENSRAMTDTALSLTEFFNQIVGVWDNYTGTTNAGGELTVAHGAPFTPRCVLVTERHSGVGHIEGPFHVTVVDKDNVTIHFLVSTSGNDRSNTGVIFDMLCLP
tara:strand:+ start:4777 stop:5139 length:363 start_codon:yes stop_codon:yes gene_type:complete